MMDKSHAWDNIIINLFIIVGLHLFGVCCGAGPPASFVFGDSLVDSGNNNYIVSLSKANYMPNGIDFKPRPQATGRYTNGRTIADILDEMLGLESFTPPYLAPTTVGNVVLHGVNYASGGGGILNETGKIFGGRINFDAQIDNFENTRRDIINSIGEKATSELLRRSIFSVTMGSNDFINNYLTPLFSEAERITVPPEMFIDTLISRFRLQLTRLYGLGARKLIVANVGPIGCIPYVREINPLAGDACVAFPNQLATQYNVELKGLVSELSSSFKDALIVYADVNHIVSDIIQNFSTYGFENAVAACCKAAGRYGGLIPCGPPSRVCADRSKFIFWDPYHPSDTTNSLIATRLFNGSSSDIFPINVQQLAQA